MGFPFEFVGRAEGERKTAEDTEENARRMKELYARLRGYRWVVVG